MSPIEFNRLVTKFSYSLKPFALSLTHDMEDAKDLLQETVYRALASQDKYEEGSNLKAWLYTIMKNIFINNYRRNKKRNTLLESVDNPFHADNVSATLNRGESAISVSEISMEINRLTEEYRIPFLMHYEGFKYHEIAEQLTLPIGTVKSRIHFARKELKRKINRA